MKADHFDQQKLLVLAAEDVALAQLAHRRRTLPEAAAADAAAEAERSSAETLVLAETEVRDLQREVRRMESDVDVVRQRAARDRSLLDSGSVSPKQMTDLQHELQSLARRQAELEDAELELMEQLETAEAAQAAAAEGRAAALAGLERAEQLRDDALADLADAVRRHESARAEVAGSVPGELLALYEKVRAQAGGTGAAMLKARQCQGCRMELGGRELSAVRNADPHEVVRCENCRRILVRTAESGL